MQREKVIFIGHGSPMNIILDNEYTRSWQKLPELWGNPKGILAISAHWYINKTATTDVDTFKQIYDMYGFPKPIYEIEYTLKNDEPLVSRIQDELGDSITINNEWGLDHGLWSVLVHALPEKNIPMAILSIDYKKSPEEHFALARKLRSYREEGYLILTSGNIVHNLRTADWNNPGLTPICQEFDDLVYDLIMKKEYEPLVNFEQLPNVKVSFPTPDHYIPFIYALGALYGDEKTVSFNRGGELASVSMTSYIFE